jgi:hypothetical protein
MLRRAVEHGEILLKILLNHLLPRRLSVADGFHLNLHLPRVSARPRSWIDDSCANFTAAGLH